MLCFAHVFICVQAGMSLRPAGTSDLPDNLKYSKWDHIEVSDDEGDSHPNIDQKLMARLKKEKRQRDYEEFRFFLDRPASLALLFSLSLSAP